MENKKTILVFCANEQKETTHQVDIDANGEIVVSCECGRFLKFPRGTSAKELKEHLTRHQEHNTGQVSQEALDAERTKFLNDLLEEYK